MRVFKGFRLRVRRVQDTGPLSRRAILSFACLFGASSAVWCEPEQSATGAVAERERRGFLGAQESIVFQKAPPFSASYTGPGSFRPDKSTTSLLTTYFGIGLSSRLQAYANIELFNGSGISNTSGLGGAPNGDAIRAGAVLPKTPYIARAYARYIHPLSDEVRPVESGWDEVRRVEPTASLQVKLGKFSPIDDFDRNRYANSARTQFLNWGLLLNTAWDLASDTRAYSNGAVLSLNYPTWAVRYGVYAVPTTSNGPDLGSSYRRGRGDNLELELAPTPGGPVARFLVYRNIAPMGIWRNAINAAPAGTVPNITDDERVGRRKYGYAVNLEIPLADGGETGLFARYGWNDGRTEMWGFADVERHLSIGMQIAGDRWSRPDDRFGIGWVRGGASNDHLDYLARGGRGLFVGDGAIRPASEYLLEMYYRFQLNKYVQISPDYQRIVNPGYNSDRGPVNIYSLRMRIAL